MYKGNKGFILKFGDLAKTLSLEDWKTTSLEDLDSDTEWVAIVTDDAEAYLNEINAIVTKNETPEDLLCDRFASMCQLQAFTETMGQLYDDRQRVCRSTSSLYTSSPG